MSDTTRKGKIAEYRFASELMKRGHEVFLPLDDGTAIDLVSLKNGDFLKCQVKYRTPKNGVLQIPKRISNVRNRRSYRPDEVDVFLVYDAKNDKGYWIPYDDFGQRENLWLRVEEPSEKYKGGGKKPILAEQYLFF